MLAPEVQAKAEEWLSLDPNAETRAEIQKLVEDGNEKDLRARLFSRIQFGTAGLRGKMAAGYTNMNDLVVLQASQGLCSYVEQTVVDCKTKGVIVGHDARYHSKDFAFITAAVFLSRGFKVYLFSDIVPTPFVAFGVVEYGCACGVMITASHNPKQDNGYKVYWENGAQIIPPHDLGIATEIEKNLKPWAEFAEGFDHQKIGSHSSRVDPLAHINTVYFEKSAQNYCFTREENKKSSLKFTYTAMHGVGTQFSAHAFEAFDLPPFIPVKEQVLPDPDFPTVAFPNPEEGKGALKLAMETSEREGSSIILANDPDADRLAVAERQQNGEWKILTGNEIALLLAHWAWENHKAKNPTADFSKCLMLSSTVSSKILKSMAKHEGFSFEETLTGFKWMGNKAHEGVQHGKTFLFAFEVEIGFLVGDISWDKDGVRTAAIFAEMSNAIYRSGKNLAGQLDALYQKYGYYVMTNKYFFCYSPETISSIFDRLRYYGDSSNKQEYSYPQSCGPYKIKSVRDVTKGYDTAQPDHKSLLPATPDSQMITFTFEDETSCTFRTSGTEPKLKYYVEVCDDEREKATQRLHEITKVLIDQFLEPEKNGLVPPKDS